MTPDDLLGKTCRFTRAFCALVKLKSGVVLNTQTHYTVLSYEPFDPRTHVAAHYVLTDRARRYRILLSSDQVSGLIASAQLQLF